MKTRIQRWFRPVKRISPRIVWQPVRSIATCVLTPIRFSISTGHGRSSLLMRAVDKRGEPIPWYTYPAIDFLSQRNYADKQILEFGSGQSTFWWGARAKFVLSVEDDHNWFDVISAKAPPNVELHHVKPKIELVEDLLKSRSTKFDVIVIDGNLRNRLVGLAFEYLAPSGALILDNSEGYGFYDELQKKPCRRIDFFGFAPGVILRHCTSVVFTDDCSLLTPDIPIPELI